jgi:ABC-type glycerol-3-phosphate transport system substrate-binding protein
VKAPVTIDFWNPATDPTGKIIIAKIVDGFNATVGKANGLFARNHIVPSDDGYVKYTTAMTSSGSPDVVMTYDYSPVVNWGVNGFIQPLDGYAKAVGIKESDFFPIAWDMISFGGHIWGLLQEFDFNQLFWNKKIHTGAPPKTIAELDALAARYNQFDKSGNLVQVGMIPWNGYGDNATDWNRLWGGQFYDHTQGKWTITKPENQRFLQWFLKYVDMFGGRGKADALVSSVPKTYGDIFFWGRAAFGLEGEYVPLELKQMGLALHYGVAHSPTSPGVPYGANRTGGGNLFLLPTKAPHPREAAIMIQYLGGKTALMDWNLGVSNIAPLKAAVFAPEYEHKMPWIKPWVDTLEFNQMEPPIQSPLVTQFNDLIVTVIDEVTYKKKTPAQALSDMATKIAISEQQFKTAHPTWPTE